MPLLSNVILRVEQPNGEMMIVEVEPQHVNIQPGSSLKQQALERGRVLAYEKDNAWYWADSRERIVDARTLALIDRCTDAVDPYMGVA